MAMLHVLCYSTIFVFTCMVYIGGGLHVFLHAIYWWRWLGYHNLHNIFLISPQKDICCGSSLEVPQRGTSNEYHNISVEK